MARAKITTLTPEQEAQIPVWREAWRAIGLSSERIVPDEARSAIRELYASAGMAAPKAIFVAQSPMQALLMRAVIQALGGGQLWGQLGDQLGGQLRDQLYQAVWMVGGWDSFWLAFYEAGRSVGATYPETLDRHLDAYIRYAKTCGVAFCYRDMAFTADRPVRLRFDEARRLHADDGAALAWSDGYGVYAWHGYRIPDTHHWIIADKGRLTVQAAMAERNAELRRIMLEIVGFERVAAELGAAVVDQDVNCGQPRRLLRAEVGGETLAILHVVNGSLEPDGTRREFHLGALSEARTCHEAVAMSYGRAPHSYREAGRT